MTPSAQRENNASAPAGRRGYAAALAVLPAAACAGGAWSIAGGQENAWPQAALAVGLTAGVLFLALLAAIYESAGRRNDAGPGWGLSALYILCGFFLLSAAWPPESKTIYAGSDYRIPYQLPGPADSWSQGMTREITVSASGSGATLIRLNLHESHDQLPPILEVTAGGRRVGDIKVKPGHGSAYPHWREKGLASSYKIIIPRGYLTPERNEAVFRPISGSWIALKSVQIWELPPSWAPWRCLIEPWNWLFFWVSAFAIALLRALHSWRAHGGRRLAMGAMMAAMTAGMAAVALCAMAGYVEARYRWMITQPDNFRSREMFYGSKHLRDAYLGWRLLPGFKASTIVNGDSGPAPFYVVNNHGFRSLKAEMEFPPSGKAMMLGDSFTQGAFLGQEETMAAVISRKLNGYVYNLGVGAYSTDQEYTAFTQWIDRVDAEWVLLLFFANDVLFVDQPVGHKFQKPAYRIADGKVDFSSLNPMPEEFVERENAKIFSQIEMEKTFCCFAPISDSVFERAVNKSQEYLRKAHYPGLLLSSIVADIRKTKGVPTPGQMDVPAEMYENPARYARQMDIVFQFIARIQEESLKRGKKFLAVYIPDYVQIQAMADPNRSKFRQAFLQLCVERGVSCLDPSSALAEGSRYNDAYFIDDGHFSPLGARIAGELIARAMTEGLR